uniref:Uncharacterized protein n=1 Tax=viral metagenome TaxID=1070528 RepID=A0A6C0AFA5_9ZZZZ
MCKNLLKIAEEAWLLEYLEFVKDTSEKIRWRYDEICKNKNITWDIVLKIDFPWDFRVLTGNKNITWEIIKNNPDKPWDYKFIIYRDDITWEIIKNNPDKPWDYEFILKHKKITYKIFKENPEIFGIEKDEYEMIEENCKAYMRKVSWRRSNWIEANPFIDEKEIEDFDYFLKPICIYDEVMNYNISLNFVNKNPQIKWDVNQISRNKYLTREIIKKSKVKFNYLGLYYLSKNELKYEKIKFIKKFFYENVLKNLEAK